MDSTTLFLLERIAVALENLVTLKVIDATIAVSTASPALQLTVPELKAPTPIAAPVPPGPLGTTPVAGP